MQWPRVAGAWPERQPCRDISAVRSPALLPTRPLRSAHVCREAVARRSCQRQLVASRRRAASWLSCILKEALEGIGVPLVSWQCGFDRVSTLASRQHLASLCSYSSQGKVIVSRNLSLREVAWGSVVLAALPRATLSWSIPAPWHSIPEMGFKLMLDVV